MVQKNLLEFFCIFRNIRFLSTIRFFESFTNIKFLTNLSKEFAFYEKSQAFEFKKSEPKHSESSDSGNQINKTLRYFAYRTPKSLIFLFTDEVANDQIEEMPAIEPRNVKQNHVIK